MVGTYKISFFQIQLNATPKTCLEFLQEQGDSSVGMSDMFIIWSQNKKEFIFDEYDRTIYFTNTFDDKGNYDAVSSEFRIDPEERPYPIESFFMGSFFPQAAFNESGKFCLISITKE